VHQDLFCHWYIIFCVSIQCLIGYPTHTWRNWPKQHSRQSILWQFQIHIQRAIQSSLSLGSIRTPIIQKAFRDYHHPDPLLSQENMNWSISDLATALWTAWNNCFEKKETKAQRFFLFNYWKEEEDEVGREIDPG
jgi:hypothetical protein